MICSKEAERQGYCVIKIFKEAFTGKDESREQWKELVKLCKKYGGFIDAVFIKDLDRFNRGGTVSHLTLKAQIAKYGVELKDVTGLIQKEKNSLELKCTLLSRPKC